MTFDELKQLWIKTCLDVGASGDGVNSMWDELVEKYSEPHRTYHTLEHVEAMLQTLREFEARLVSPSTVYTAAFFHDAIYDVMSTTNEKDSAEMAVVFLNQNSVPMSVSTTVESLILATAAHFDPTETTDSDWFLDADLAILGSEPERYAWYVSAIRDEYAIIPDDQFRAGRQRFLETTLKAKTLFRTCELRDRFEERARSNLKNELDNLIAEAN